MRCVATARRTLVVGAFKGLYQVEDDAQLMSDDDRLELPTMGRVQREMSRLGLGRTSARPRDCQVLVEEQELRNVRLVTWSIDFAGLRW
jgi:hypothetical protein